MRSYISPEIDALDVGVDEYPQFGLSMDGNQSCMIRAARLVLGSKQVGESFHYVEIGIASGFTLRAMGTCLRSIGIAYNDLHVTGVDLEDGWSIDRDVLAGNLENFPCEYEICLDGSESFLKSYTGPPIDYLLIDGCHEKDCVMRDFMLAEHLISTGGVIVFHDSDDVAQEIQNQGHRGEPIRVRQALLELGLLNNTRDGWVKLADIEAFPTNHGVAIFKYEDHADRPGTTDIPKG